MYYTQESFRIGCTWGSHCVSVHKGHIVCVVVKDHFV